MQVISRTPVTRVWQALTGLNARFFITVLLLAGLTMPVRAELMIRITEGADSALPVAVVPFGETGEIPADGRVGEIIRNNLAMTGEFEPLGSDRMLSLPTRGDDVYYRDWRMLGQRYLLVGELERSGDRINARYELFDVNREERILGENASSSVNGVRGLAHHISDKIYEAITGEEGAFSTRLAYVTVERVDGERLYKLQVSDVDGQRSSVRLESDEPILSPAWSPDAKKLAYVSFESGRPAIYTHELSSGERQKMATFSGLNSAPDWSPDGRSLLMTLSKDGNAEIYRMDVESRSLKRLTNHWGIDTEASTHAEGKGFVFTSDRSGGPQVYYKSSDSAEPKRMTFSSRYNARPRLSPDGEDIFYVHQRDSAFHIARLNIESGDETILTRTKLDESPSLAPNGRMLIYATQQDGRSVLTVISADGGEAYTLPASEGDVREPAWSPRR